MPPSKPKLTNEGQIPGEGSSVGAISFSPDGSLLATGNDLGILTIRQPNSDWKRLRRLYVGSKIRAIVWHPLKPLSLLVGCGSGNLYCISLQYRGQEVHYRDISGFIHSLAINPQGTQLAIGFTGERRTCAGLISQPFSDVQKPIQYLQTPLESRDITIPHQTVYLNVDVVLVAWFGAVGLYAYSAHHPHNILWRIPPGDNSWMGGIAVSPSSQLLAVWNMAIGIEWYSLADRRHLSTTTYQSLGRAGQRRVVRLVFIDEKTIAMGHVDGQVVIASWCCKRDPPQFSMQRNDKKRGFTQIIAFHVIRGTPTLLTANGEGRDAVLVLLRVDLPPDDAGDLLRFQLATNPGHFMFNTFYCTCTGFILFVSVALLVLALVISNWPLFVVTSTV